MTIRLPKYSLFDKVLSTLGKKRGLIVNSAVYKKYGPHAYYLAQKESFLKALFRPAQKPLPEGMIDFFRSRE